MGTASNPSLSATDVVPALITASLFGVNGGDGVALMLGLLLVASPLL
ncbi:hypothetical protein [Arthrobacter sp. SLBN-122]|nr:hypothetical protein [Arthrobacter sp. SLBN-122]